VLLNISLLTEFESISVFYFVALFFLDGLSMCVSGDGCVYACCVCACVYVDSGKEQKKTPKILFAA